MMELASLLNTRTALCTAFYDPDEASLMVCASAPIHDSTNFDEIVELLIVNAGRIAKNFIELAMPVLRGQMTPYQVIAATSYDQPE